MVLQINIRRVTRIILDVGFTVLSDPQPIVSRIASRDATVGLQTRLRGQKPAYSIYREFIRIIQIEIHLTSSSSSSRSNNTSDRTFLYIASSSPATNSLSRQRATSSLSGEFCIFTTLVFCVFCILCVAPPG